MKWSPPDNEIDAGRDREGHISVEAGGLRIQEEKKSLDGRCLLEFVLVINI